MKKRFLPGWGGALLLLCLLFMTTGGALAEEAADITARCQITAPKEVKNPEAMYTDDLNTFLALPGEELAYLDIETPADSPAHGLYIVWAYPPGPWEVLVNNPDWSPAQDKDDAYAAPPYVVEQAAGQDGFVHEYVPLFGLTKFRLQRRLITDAPFGIVSLKVLGEGDLPGWVQDWWPAPDKAELMVIATHPDDELLFLGGTLPTYAGEQGLETVVVHATYGNRVRRSELLNALWICGVRTYPILGDFVDTPSQSSSYTTAFMPPDDVCGFITEQLRRFRPQVVVTQDLNGEYGHGAHRVLTQAVLDAVREKVADPEAYPESAALYGTCQVPKLYMHLYPVDTVRMDWNQPLPYFGGKTALDVAEEAWFCHISQQSPTWKIRDMGPYDNTAFGLVHTLVGYDEAGNDFFEHIDQWQDETP